MFVSNITEILISWLCPLTLNEVHIRLFFYCVCACKIINHVLLWRVWRYQKGNQNPYIEEEQTTQWPIKKQRSTKHTYKTKDGVTRTPLKTGCVYPLKCVRCPPWLVYMYVNKHHSRRHVVSLGFVTQYTSCPKLLCKYWMHDRGHHWHPTLWSYYIKNEFVICVSLDLESILTLVIFLNCSFRYSYYSVTIRYVMFILA